MIFLDGIIKRLNYMNWKALNQLIRRLKVFKWNSYFDFTYKVLNLIKFHRNFSINSSEKFALRSNVVTWRKQNYFIVLNFCMRNISNPSRILQESLLTMLPAKKKKFLIRKFLKLNYFSASEVSTYLAVSLLNLNVPKLKTCLAVADIMHFNFELVSWEYGTRLFMRSFSESLT